MGAVDALVGHVGHAVNSPDLAVGEGVKANSMEGHAARWLIWLRDVRERRPNTLRTYEYVLSAWLDWCHSNRVDPALPSLDDGEAFMARRRWGRSPGRKGAPATKRTDVVVLRTWFAWMAGRGLVVANPFAELVAPTVPVGLPKPIPDGVWLTLWAESIERLKGAHAGTALRLHLALGLGYTCGLRRAEFVGLTGRNFQDDFIVKFTRKGGGDDTLPWRSMLGVYQDELPQLLPDADGFVERLAAHTASNPHNRLWWSDGQQLHKNLTNLCTRAGTEHYTPHQLRHSCATNLLRAGVPIHIVSKLMNHSSIDITMRYAKVAGFELNEWRNGSKG